MRVGWIVLVAGVFMCLLMACCDSPTKGNGEYEDVCKTNPFDPKCGEECISSVDCGPDLHCRDGKCRADCTPDGNECGPDSICLPNGHCAEKCAAVNVNLEHVQPTVILLIDQSGSMDESFGNQTRWEAVETALVDQNNGVVFALEDEILFGASLYTSHGGFGGGECPILDSVKPALNNATAVQSLLNANGPDGDTPTGESILAVVDLLNSDWQNDVTTLRLIVLATDGEPDTCAVPNPQEGQADSIHGAQEAFRAGVRTVILSVGRDVSAPHLQDIANAGAGLPVGGPDNEPYYVADNPDQLTTAFEEIAQSARSCIFALDGEIRPPEYAAYGDVRLNGEKIEYDHPNGWRLIDPSTIELLGDACQTFLTQENVELEASFPCGAVWTP